MLITLKWTSYVCHSGVNKCFSYLYVPLLSPASPIMYACTHFADTPSLADIKDLNLADSKHVPSPIILYGGNSLSFHAT